MEVLYEYEVDGVRYTSDRIGFGEVIGSERTVKQAVERYPRGDLVTVYYDPQEPSLCVLERKMDEGPKYVVLVVALVCFLGGIITVINSLI